MAANFVCNICGKQFMSVMSENALYDHNKGVHNEVESPCTQCDKTFRSKVKLAYHIRSTHAERESFHCDMRSGENLCIFFLQQWAISGLTRKEYMRKLKMSITPHLLVVCVTTKPLLSLIWRHSDKCEKSVQANLIDLSCKVCHKKYSTKKILNKHAKLHDKQVSDSQPSTAVSCVVCKKRLWTDGTWTDTRRMTMDSQREGMWLKTVLALHYSQQKLLWKRQWSKRGQRKWVTNAISASIKPAKDRISVDTNTTSITDLNLKWEEGNERLVLFLEELNIEEQQKIRTSLHRERSRRARTIIFFFVGRHADHHVSHLVGHHASPHVSDHASHLVGHHVQQHVRQEQKKMKKGRCTKNLRVNVQESKGKCTRI